MDARNWGRVQRPDAGRPRALRYRLRDAYAVLRTPIGRSQVMSGLYYRVWPLMWRLANL